MNQSSTRLSDRIVVFKELTKSDIENQIDQILMDKILDPHYNQFVEFCEEIKNDQDLKSVSLCIENDQLVFVKHY